MSFGKARFGNDRGNTYAKKNYFSVNENEQVFGIFPPMFELADKGTWTRYYKVHFGYKNSEGKFRPFLSTLKIDYETKAVVTPDPAVDLINNYKAQSEQAKKDGNLQLAARYDKLVGMKGIYNLDKNWHMNVHDLAGNVGTLKIRQGCMIKLEDVLKKLEAKGIDPFDSVNGRYFTFRRIGTGPTTSFEVGVYAPEVEFHGRMVPEEKIRTISPELEAKANKELTSLDSLFTSLTVEEIKAVVDSVDLLTGKSTVLDAIDLRRKQEREAKKNGKAASQTSSPVAAATTAAQTPVEDEEPSGDLDKTYAPANTTAAKALATPVAQEASAALEVPTQAAATASFEEMDDAEFFKAVGLKAHG